MLVQDLWQIEPNGLLTTDTDEFRLVVRKVSGAVRFLVQRHPRPPGPYPCAILASGTENGVREAMTAAARTAARLSTAERGRLHRQQAVLRGR